MGKWSFNTDTILQKEIYIWGGGVMGASLFPLLSEHFTITAVIDSNPESALIRECPIVHPSAVLKKNKGEFFIIIALMQEKAIREVIATCLDNGLSRGNDFAFPNEVIRISPLPPLPPDRIPQRLVNDFTFNQTIPLIHKYSDIALSRSIPFSFTETIYEHISKLERTRSIPNFAEQMLAFYDAFDAYDFNGKSVMVWYVDTCLFDVMALNRGSEKIYTSHTHLPYRCDNAKVTIVDLEELSRKNIKVDRVLSHSLHEHAGLGRYGEELDPAGDVKEMDLSAGLLNDGGVLFLGLPFGKDALIWNDRRIYGEKHIRRLLRGWNCIDVFCPYDTSENPNYPFDLPLYHFHYFVLVLQKASDPVAVRLDSGGNFATQKPEIAKRINAIIQ